MGPITHAEFLGRFSKVLEHLDGLELADAINVLASAVAYFISDKSLKEQEVELETLIMKVNAWLEVTNVNKGKEIQ